MNTAIPFPTSAAQVVQAKLETITVKLCNAMGAVSVMEAAAPNDVATDAPDYKRASRAIYCQLDNILTELNALDDELDHGRPLNCAPEHPARA